MIDAHTDVVGSLLRPAFLLDARQQYAHGTLTPAEFKVIEDQAVDAAIVLQEQAGLDVLTDGEMRRLSFQSQMTEAVAGFGTYDMNAFLWGDWRGDTRTGNRTIERPTTLGVTDKLARKRHLSAEEFTYLRRRTTRIPKVTLPSPSLWANFWSPHLSRAAYPTLDSFLADVTNILRDEVAELVRLGATYIQLDAPHYPLLLDPDTRACYEQRGWTVEQWLQQGIALDNAVMADFPTITFGFHLCRGNQDSRWLVAGGYDLLARPLFQGITAQRLLLEYDDERSGSFAPLREVPADKLVVLGLVTTKSGRVETVTDLTQRINAASQYIDRDRLALSPQCGFATSILGNHLTHEDQERKLRCIVETARQVWSTPDQPARATR